MAAVLDPSAVTDLLSGYFVWSSEDDRAYIVTASGAIPLVGDRALTTLTDAALSPMGPDGLVRINGVLVPELPGSPITVGDSRFEGRLEGYWNGNGEALLDAASSLQRITSLLPLAQFANDEQGGWYDFNDASTIWADTAGTTPATTGGAVARVDDKSGNGNHLIHATAANRPIWTQDGTASHLTFDGANDHLHTSASVDWTATDEISVYTVLTKTSDAAAAIWLFSGGTNAFSSTAPNVTEGTQITFRSTGGTLRTANANYAAPTTKVFGGRAKITTDQCEVWINGALAATGAGDQGAATAYSAGTMVVGAGNATAGTPTKRLTGKLTGELIIVTKWVDDDTHMQIINYLNELAGIY